MTETLRSITTRARERARRQMRARHERAWFRIEDQGETAEVFLYDVIGEDPFGGGVGAQAFAKELRAITAPRLLVRINSPGGDVFDGVAIHTALVEHPARVEVRIDGLAASIASVVAMAGERITMARGALLMIHEPAGLALGTAADLRGMAEALDLMGTHFAGFYARRAGGAKEAWRERMRAETWYGDEQAVAAGLADEVADEAAVAARFDLSFFDHPPRQLAAAAQAHDADVAAALRRLSTDIQRAGKGGGR